MSYQKDRDALTRGAGAIAAADMVARARQGRRQAIGAGTQQRDRAMAAIARGSLGAVFDPVYQALGADMRGPKSTTGGMRGPSQPAGGMRGPGTNTGGMRGSVRGAAPVVAPVKVGPPNRVGPVSLGPVKVTPVTPTSPGNRPPGGQRAPVPVRVTTPPKRPPAPTAPPLPVPPPQQQPVGVQTAPGGGGGTAATQASTQLPTLPSLPPEDPIDVSAPAPTGSSPMTTMLLVAGGAVALGYFLFTRQDGER